MSCALTFVAASTYAGSVYRVIPIDGFSDAIRHWNDSAGEGGIPPYFLTDISSIIDNFLLCQRNDGGSTYMPSSQTQGYSCYNTFAGNILPDTSDFFRQAEPLLVRLNDLEKKESFLVKGDGKKLFTLADTTYERHTGSSEYGT